MKIVNNKPADITPVHAVSMGGAFSPADEVKEVLVKPLLTPLVASSPCKVTDNGVDMDEDAITKTLMDCMGNSLNTPQEDKAKEFMSCGLISFNKKTTLTFRSVFAIQSAVKAQLPEPSMQVVYTPSTDVVPVSKKYLAGKVTYDEYFATMAFYTKSNTLGFYFANKTAFDDFKSWLANELNQINQSLPPETNQMFSDFMKLELKGLTESLLLRSNDGENNDPYTFARGIVAYLMAYTKQAGLAEFGVLPFDAAELFVPRAIVLVNVEAHSRASSKQIAEEWDDINKAVANKPTVLSNKHIQSLTGAVKALKKMSGAAIYQNASQTNGGRNRVGLTKFRKAPPTKKDVTRYVMNIMKKMHDVAKSENTYKQVKVSFAKPNRRDPDDFNKMGKTVSTKYHPDIHVYLDCSGSISEENYEDAIRMLILIARKLNVSLYFNSFSDVMSQCYKVNTRDRSVSDCWRMFQKIPKVDGGTNYEQIWHYINNNRRFQRELSIVITDFEWRAPSYYVKHPKNLYYMPVSQVDWDHMVYWAGVFAKSMVHIDPSIRKKIFA